QSRTSVEASGARLDGAAVAAIRTAATALSEHLHQAGEPAASARTAGRASERVKSVHHHPGDIRRARTPRRRFLAHEALDLLAGLLRDADRVLASPLREAGERVPALLLPAGCLRG